MNGIASFQAFGDEVYTNSELLAAALRYRPKINEKLGLNA
jgi:hypothetical protein